MTCPKGGKGATVGQYGDFIFSIYCQERKPWKDAG